MEPIREFRNASEVWPDTDFEVRAESPEGLNFKGYAAVFDSESSDMGGFVETIAPGAFKKSLAERKRSLKMFLNHDWDVVLASTKGKTLRLTEDNHGLHADADLPDNEWGRPVRDAVVRGDIDSMSFGFNVDKDEWTDDRKERRIIEAKLWEVSPVTSWPAYPATSASVRHLADLIDEPEDVLEAATRVLFDEAGELTDEQHALLMRAIGARTTKAYVPADTAELMARLLAKDPH